jgi:hypothetical protein
MLVWEIGLVRGDAAGLVGVALVSAATRDEALALIRTDLAGSSDGTQIDDREVTSHGVDPPRVLSIHYW